MSLILWFNECSHKNKNLVGGKCSSLGELNRLSKKNNFSIADGFAITTTFYDIFLEQNKLTDIIYVKMQDIDIDNITDLENKSDEIRNLIISGFFTEDQKIMINKYYKDLCNKYNINNLEVAIRSSAIAEDLPNASFAGQQDTFLNISGINNIIQSIKECFSSLFSSRAISYRKRHDIKFSDVKISTAVQKMVKSDIGSAGVAFSIDPESSYDKAIVINSSFGLGESVVSGSVKPDEFIIDKRVLSINSLSDPIITKKLGNKINKIIYAENGGTINVETTLQEQQSFSLTEEQVIKLATHVIDLEKEYSEMYGKKIGIDVEWAIDGIDQQIYILQTRPETVHSNNDMTIKKYVLDNSGKSKLLFTGIAVGQKISTGKVKILQSMKDHKMFKAGDILVTDFTSPDFEPVMKIASAIITNRGGRTCHAAIIAREMGLCAIVGCGNATELLKDGDIITVSCCDGEEGQIYEGIIKYHINEMNISNDPMLLNKLPIKVMTNVGNPDSCFSNSMLPNSGVGLLRAEFIISNHIKIHPLALYNYPDLPDDIKSEIANIIKETDGKQYFIEQFARGVGKIASAFYPKDVILRLSDFKSNEYRNMIGGSLYEPIEENPLLGIRGAIRYYLKEYEQSFELECEAIKYARTVMKMDNLIIMIPFCRTPAECKLVIEKLAQNGLVRGVNGLKIYIMCEIISNVIEAEEFSPLIDGVSIGGNDLLMLTVGTDRDNEVLASIANDKNLSYRRLIKMAINTYKKNGIKVGYCGNQVSSSTEFCEYLINEGIDSISVTSDVVLQTIMNLSKIKK